MMTRAYFAIALCAMLTAPYFYRYGSGLTLALPGSRVVMIDWERLPPTIRVRPRIEGPGIPRGRRDRACRWHDGHSHAPFLPSAVAAQAVTEADAIAILRAAHAAYKADCGTRFAHCLYSDRRAPGWIYDPIKDCIAAKPKEMADG